MLNFGTHLKSCQSPITSTSPSSMFVGVDQSITYGSATGMTILAATSGVTDTGTTLLLLATGERSKCTIEGLSLTVSIIRRFRHLPDCYRRSPRFYDRASSPYACAVCQPAEPFLQHWQCEPLRSRCIKMFILIPLQNTFEFTPNAQIWPRAVSVRSPLSTENL